MWEIPQHLRTAQGWHCVCESVEQAVKTRQSPAPLLRLTSIARPIPQRLLQSATIPRQRCKQPPWLKPAVVCRALPSRTPLPSLPYCATVLQVVQRLWMLEEADGAVMICSLPISSTDRAAMLTGNPKVPLVAPSCRRDSGLSFVRSFWCGGKA